MIVESDLLRISGSVFGLMRKIPPGKVVSYGQIAKALKLKSPRLVGRILHGNPDPKTIPCHRAVFADGRVSSRFAFGGAAGQIEKLRLEAISFEALTGKVNLKKHLLLKF